MNKTTLRYLDAKKRISYKQSIGSSTSLLFCGGFKSSMDGNKAKQLHHYADLMGWSFTRFDYSGHGSSDGKFIDGNIGIWLSEALRIFDQLPGNRHILIGSSMGAWISLLIAIRRQSQVAGIVTLAAACDFLDELIWQKLSTEEKQSLRTGQPLLIATEYDDGSPYPISYQLIEDSMRYNLLKSPIDIHCPVRMLHGVDDKDITWKTSERIMERISGADVRLTLIKNADHRLQGTKNFKLMKETIHMLVSSLA